MEFKHLLKYGFLVVATNVLLSCGNNESARIVIAEVGEKKLYLEELNEIIPEDLEKNDSILMADDYIKKWVKLELLIKKAEENLSFEQKNMTKELQEYRNSLIIYKYKNELMKQKMDTLVTDTQIENYYQQNPDNFKLNKNIVKAIFIQIPSEFANPQQLKDYCSNASEEGLEELREYCLQYAKKFDIVIDKWIDFDIVSKNIPLKIDNPELYLQKNDVIELNDSSYYYLVSIQEYKLKTESAPINYITDNIRNLILNKRKIGFLKEIEDNVYSEGIRKNKFKINTQN